MARNALTNLWSGDGRLRREPYVAGLLVLFGLMYGTHVLVAGALIPSRAGGSARCGPYSFAWCRGDSAERIRPGPGIIHRIHGRVLEHVKALSE